MSDPSRPTPSDSASDAELDTLLAGWATRQRLHPDEAERLLTGILGPDPDPSPVTVVTPTTALPVTWWAQLSQQVTAAVVLAATRPATGTLAPA